MAGDGIEVTVVHLGPRAGVSAPLRFVLGDNKMEVAEVIDHWPGEDHEYWKLRTTDGDLYLLRHDLASDRWWLVMYSSRDAPAE